MLKHPNLFFEIALFFVVSHSGDSTGMSRAKICVKLSNQQYNLLFCMILHGMVVCLFIYVLRCLYDIFVCVAMFVC